MKKENKNYIYTRSIFAHCERSSTITLKYSPFIFPFVLVAYVMLAFLIDYKLAVHQHKPFFAAESRIYKDGGTTEYKGIGYKVIDYNQLMNKNGRTDVVFSSRFINYENKRYN